MKRLLAVLLLVAGGCGNGSDTPVDAPITVDIDNGSCGDELRFTGEYIDFDSDASFCGINEALFQVTGDGAMDTTAPNGRFDLCIPSAPAQVILEITPAAEPSQCTVPASTYSLPGIAVANRNVILAGTFWSGRNITVDRQTSLGVTLDPAKAHVFVHVEGAQRAVSLEPANHGPAQAVVDRDWAPGNTGHAVFFPNVEVGAGSVVVAVAGGALGTGAVPVVAGTITNVAVKTN
jgi:hypothetical protein